MEHRQTDELTHMFYYTLEQFCQRYGLDPIWVRDRIRIHAEDSSQDFNIVISEFDLLLKCGIEVTPMFENSFFSHEDPRKIVKVLL